MKITQHLIRLLSIFIILPMVGFSHTVAENNRSIKRFALREAAYQANNLGVALLEQYKHEEGVAEFRKALSLRPGFALAQTNLAIALFNAQQLAEAKNTAAQALKLTPDSPQVYYILGLVARTENQPDDALAAFQKVIEIDPRDVGANVNVGQLLSQRKQYDEAQQHFQTAYDAEPYNLSVIYNLATTLQRKGDRARAAELLKDFQTLRENGAGTSIGLNYLEQGRYAEAVASTGAESELVDARTPAVGFTEATTKMFGGARPTVKSNAATLFDYDNDGKLDLVLARSGFLSLYHNENGRFRDVTEKSGDLSKNYEYLSNSVVAGDYDNDLKPDLLAVRTDGFTLYRNEGNGRFTETTKTAGLPVHKSDDRTLIGSLSCAFVDADHDGDLDIFAPGGIDFGVDGGNSEAALLPNKLFRNNGNGTFTDISKDAGIADKLAANAVVPTDFDNRRDIDLLVVGDRKTALYRNQRNGSFKDVAPEVGIDVGGKAAAVGDVNKDGFVDFFIGRDDGASVLFVSDGKGKFKRTKISPEKISALSAQFLDYDNDGLLDLVTSGLFGTRIWRNLGNEWREVNKSAQLEIGGSFVSGDLDKDGDLDLVFVPLTDPIKILRNDGGNLNNSVTLSLQGRVSNKTGVGAKIDLRAGSLTQKLESYAASPMPAPSEAHFGLGKREKPDAVRVIWTSGIVQTEIETPIETKNQIAKNRVSLKIEELDRKPSSCPYLYTWNGEKFEFITDFMGGGEMGDWTGSSFSYPDPEEYVRIASDQLKPKDGRYELRVTNELEEVLFVDRLKLVAVDHPADTEVYPNEGLGIPNGDKFILYTTRDEHPPLTARDGYGNDVLGKIAKLDRKFYDTFKKRSIRGYAEPHELILTLDDKSGDNGRTLLLMTGWTDYAFSSDNLAAAQQGMTMQYPSLQVRDKRGAWQTVIDSIGFSVGRPQTLVVDLTGKFLSDNREVRILTTMRTYWDKIAVDTSADASSDLRVTASNPIAANLRERGFSKETSPDGKEPFGADYDDVNFEPKWKYFAGTFTRLGDVRLLLNDADDVFIISKTGDEIVLSFDVSAFPPPVAGAKRTFLLHANGYSKEMDINSGSPEAVFPVPFHKMSKYPYNPSVEKFPMTEEKQKIYDEYTTRFVRGGFPKNLVGRK